MQRLLTAVVAIPFAVLVARYSPEWLFALVAGVLSAIALDEYLELSVALGYSRPGRWFLIPGAIVAASFFGGPAWVLTSLTGATLCLMTAAVFAANLNDALPRVAAGLSGIVYCSVLLGFMVLLPRDSIFVLFAIVWAGDSLAYYGGRAFGRHLLAPLVSPKKTIEGAVSGLVGSIVAGTALGLWLLGLPWLQLALLSAVTAVAGQIGDLAESALKRSARVKDSSSILPGHGGILDRLDSLLFATPVFFWLLNA